MSESVDSMWAAFADDAAPAISPELNTIWGAYRERRDGGASPFHAALAVASRVGDTGFPCALCVTESGGNHPRAISTSLQPTERGYHLSGTKTFVTFGSLAKTLIVVARSGDKPDGRPDLTVVRIPANRRGVTLHELPPTPFVPEVLHASVSFDAVEVEGHERLPGDGYLQYVKPFRTIEDIHVVGAALGYLIGWTQRVGASRVFVAKLFGDLVTLDRLRLEPPLDPAVHVALHGVIQDMRDATAHGAFQEALTLASPEEAARWARDRDLLKVADKAREARFARAIERRE